MSTATTKPPTFAAAKVKKLRERLGLNSAQLAAKLGITAALISMFESGKRTPQGPVAILLAQMADRLGPDKAPSCKPAARCAPAANRRSPAAKKSAAKMAKPKPAATA
jgi:transcriptional regulator with XRE-family HTH domain